jgi:hypothetical protein
VNGNAGNKYLEKKIGRLLTFGVWRVGWWGEEDEDEDEDETDC